MTCSAAILTSMLLVGTGTSMAAPANVLTDPGFEQRSPEWKASGNSSRYAVVPNEGRAGTACLRYFMLAAGSDPGENSHYDQVVAVQPDTLYVAGAWFRTDGTLRPVLRIAGMEWQTLALGIAPPSRDWHEARLTWFSGSQRQVRFQVFGGSLSEKRESAPGTSHCDDAFLRPAADADVREMRRCWVAVDPQTVLRPVNPLFFGANALYWIEDDAARADDKIARALREMPCRLLRFPGGTAADNYHWKTGRLHNPKRYPYKDGPATMDTDEFMALCREVGAEPILVVNLETSFVVGDLDAGIREAVEWVRYCQEKGYRVRYWEIGNEQYLLPHMGAREYAEAFLKFARAMRAADPTAKFGAVGPTGVDASGRADRLTPEERKQLQAMSDQERQEAQRTLGRGRRGTPWWPTVLAVAGREMDMAVVHEYFPATPGGPLHLQEGISSLREGIRRALPGREVLIALTEWNVNQQANVAGMGQALVIAEAIGQFLSGGVDLATFWPLRFGGDEWGPRALLELESKEPGPSYQAMALLAQHLGARLVQATASNPHAYACASESADGKEVSLFLVNRGVGIGAMDVEIAVGGAAPAAARAQVLTASDPASEDASLQELAVSRVGDAWRCRLPAHSLAVVTFSR